MLATVAAPSMDTITSALNTGLTTAANGIMSEIGAILPIVLPVVGGIIVVYFGIKFFRRMAH